MPTPSTDATPSAETASNATVQQLVRKASDTCKEGNLEEALVIAADALRLANELGNTSDIFDALSASAWLLTLASRIEEARDDLSKASKLVDRVTPKQQSRYYFVASELSNSFSEYIQSSEEIEKAITV